MNIKENFRNFVKFRAGFYKFLRSHKVEKYVKSNHSFAAHHRLSAKSNQTAPLLLLLLLLLVLLLSVFFVAAAHQMADELSSRFGMLCDKLDSDAGAFWDNAEMKQLLLEVKEAHYLLQNVKRYRSDQNVNTNSLFAALEGVASGVDGLVDAWVQSEISRPKFDQKLRRAHARLAPLLNSLRKVVAGDDEDEETTGSIYEVSSRSSEQAVLESDHLDKSILESNHLEKSISSVKCALLRNVNMTLVLLVVGVSGTVNTALAHGIFINEEVKSHFPFSFWFSVAKKLVFSRVVKAIRFHCSEIHRAQKMGERLLIVMDDVCDLNVDELKEFRLLISNDMGNLVPCVLVTTRSDLVASMMSRVPAHHLTYIPESNSWSDVNLELLPLVGAHSCERGHEKDLRGKAPKSAGATELQRNSTSGLEGEMPGHFEELSKSVLNPCTECQSATDDDAASNPEILTANKLKCSPPTDVDKSEPQLKSLETAEELSTHVPGTRATSSDDAIHGTVFEDGSFQDKEKVRRILYWMHGNHQSRYM